MRWAHLRVRVKSVLAAWGCHAKPGAGSRRKKNHKALGAGCLGCRTEITQSEASLSNPDALLVHDPQRLGDWFPRAIHLAAQRFVEDSQRLMAGANQDVGYFDW